MYNTDPCWPFVITLIPGKFFEVKNGDKKLDADGLLKCTCNLNGVKVDVTSKLLWRSRTTNVHDNLKTWKKHVASPENSIVAKGISLLQASPPFK